MLPVIPCHSRARGSRCITLIAGFSRSTPHWNSTLWIPKEILCLFGHNSQSQILFHRSSPCGTSASLSWGILGTLVGNHHFDIVHKCEESIFHSFCHPFRCSQ